MLGKPKYERYDIVRFNFRDEVREGYIYIVDSFGTFEQEEEPSYDILIVGGSNQGLYKHIRESRVIEKIGKHKEK